MRRRWLIVGLGLAGVVGVVGVAMPLEAQARWRLQEVARVGGADEGLASFNGIRDVQIDGEGRIWVLDFQMQSLRLFAADGTPIRELARKGKGPGELANANGFRRAPDGRMIVRDHSNARLAVYAPDGSVLTHHTAISSGYGYRWDAAVDGQGRLIEIMTVRRGEEFTRALVRHAADFSGADTLELPTTCSDLPPPKAGIRGRNGFVSFPLEPRVVATLAEDGAFWCANTDEYRLRRFTPGRSAHDRELVRTVPRVPVPAAERDSLIRGTEAFLERIGGAVEPWDKGSVRRDRGALLGFEGDDQGRLWVMRELAGGRFEFDVWDAAGRHVATLPVTTRREYMPLFRVRGDRLVIVTPDEDDLPTIFVYRILTS